MPGDASWQREITENMERYQALHERLGRLSITETSPCGTVQVTVGANGLLTNLVLTERGRAVPLATVSGMVMDCMRRAQARIPALLREAMAQTVGDTDPNSHLLVADAAQRFPEPLPPAFRAWQPTEMRIAQTGRPQQAARPKEQAAKRPAEQADDDWADSPILRDIAE